jgi:DNA mismatch repair ATPase MutS
MNNFFNERISRFKELEVQYGKRSGTFTVIRIILFIFFLALWIFLLNESLFSPFLITLVLFPFVFGFVVNRHKRINYKQQFNQHLVLINEEEVNRLEFKPRHFSNGPAHLNEAHSYTGDLDIFGPKSLYHFINRTATPSGEETLADWLKAPSGKEEIVERQESIAELSEQIDWRQEIQATELEISHSGSLNLFMEWLKKPSARINNVVIYLMPLLMVLTIILWITGAVSFYVPAAILLINGYIIGKYAKTTHHLSEVTENGLATLKKYRHILFLIEGREFKSAKLRKIQQLFNDDGYKASGALKNLERILEFLDARSNMFYHILNIIFLIDLHLIVRAESWRSRNNTLVSHWFDAIGELEALCSFAGFHFAGENLTFPVIRDEPYHFEAKNLGHPLISDKERVNNDYLISGKGAVHIITGSNMSGKSTFLRTVCINAVIAYAGGPVCAEKLELSIMQVFTSMRTHDDLEAHVSSFYAELKRIRQLLNKLKDEPEPVLFALDEVLKGTNSHDRQAGAAALTRQLHQQNCMGMISTHDLELGEMAKESQEIKNFSFNSDITDDKIIFDYKIHEGICRSFNASKLMQQMGIDLNAE